MQPIDLPIRNNKKIKGQGINAEGGRENGENSPKKVFCFMKFAQCEWQISQG